MNPDRTGRKVVCRGATPACTTLYIAEAGLHWNRFNFMSIMPRLFFPSPTILHSETVVQPFMAAFRDSPPMQEKYKKLMPCIRRSNPQYYSYPGQDSPHFQPKNCPFVTSSWFQTHQPCLFPSPEQSWGKSKAVLDDFKYKSFKVCVISF